MELEESEKIFWLSDLGKFSEGEWQRFLPWIEQEFMSIIDYAMEDSLIIIEEIETLNHKLKEVYKSWSNELENCFKKKTLPISQKALLENFIKLPLKVIKSMKSKKILEISFDLVIES